MGDRCSITLELGGKITEQQVRELCELMVAENLLADGTHAPCRDNIDETFYADEVNYGLIKPVTDYCDAAGIAYELWNAAGGSYGEGVTRSDGTRTETCPCSEAVPMHPLSEILRVEALASGLAKAIDLARFMCGPLPQLEIVP